MLYKYIYKTIQKGNDQQIPLQWISDNAFTIFLICWILIYRGGVNCISNNPGLIGPVHCYQSFFLSLTEFGKWVLQVYITFFAGQNMRMRCRENGWNQHIWWVFYREHAQSNRQSCSATTKATKCHNYRNYLSVKRACKNIGLSLYSKSEGK